MKILVVQDGYCYQLDKYRETNCASYPVDGNLSNKWRYPPFTEKLARKKKI